MLVYILEFIMTIILTRCSYTISTKKGNVIQERERAKTILFGLILIFLQAVAATMVTLTAGLLGTVMTVSWGMIVNVLTYVVQMLFFWWICASICKKMSNQGHKIYAAIAFVLALMVVMTCSYVYSSIVVSQFENMATENVFEIFMAMTDKRLKILNIVMDIMVFVPGVIYVLTGWMNKDQIEAE